MTAEFIRCYTCRLALRAWCAIPLHLHAIMRCRRVLLFRLCAEPCGLTRLRIWRASSSCWNAGAGGHDEIRRVASPFRANQCFSLPWVRRKGRRSRVGQCLPRCPETPPTLAALLTGLCLGPAPSGTLVPKYATLPGETQPIPSARLCSLPTRATAHTHGANHQSPLVRGALPLSLPLRTRDSRETALSALVYHALPARLWPSATQDHDSSATAAAAPGDRAPVRRPGGWFLERLSHLPRPGHRGSDVA